MRAGLVVFTLLGVLTMVIRVAVMVAVARFVVGNMSAQGMAMGKRSIADAAREYVSRS